MKSVNQQCPKLLQGVYANIKTILPAQKVCDFVLAKENWPDASVVWARHDANVTHWHIVIRFPSRCRWQSLADWLKHSSRDPHAYCRCARSWRRSVRYLLHLDSPEKPKVPWENLGFHGIDESEIGELMSASKLPILESLILAQQIPLKKRFEFLIIQRGHTPSEVSSALRCMMDLEKWEQSRTCGAVSKSSALPASIDDVSTGDSDGSDFSDDSEADSSDGFASWGDL